MRRKGSSKFSFISTPNEGYKALLKAIFDSKHYHQRKRDYEIKRERMGALRRKLVKT